MATPFFSLLLLLLLLSPFSLRCNAQNGNDLLQQSEVDALNNITSMLGVKPQRYYDTYTCRRTSKDPYDGVLCRCDINVLEGNSTRQICVVTDLIFRGLDLTGVISPAVGNLLYLTTIDLSYNQLHGPIPNIFGRNHSLRSLSLGFNFLEGHIPPSLGDLLNLTNLDLASNLLTGQIPSRLGNAGSLLYLHLWDNNLSGTIPPELGNLQELIRMQISGNNFKGELPRTFKNLKKLKVFSVRGNDLSGPVPDFITKWTNLRNLVLMGNNFVGVLPTGIFQLKKLTQLWVTDLNVSANFSFPQLSNLTILTSLILRNCSIVDEIPDYVAKMKLHDLDLSYNNLTGEIPAGLKNLDYLCLTRNNFNGVFPDWAPNSTLMDFSYNNFTYREDSNNTSYVNTFSPAVLPTEIMKGSCPHEKQLEGDALRGRKITLQNILDGTGGFSPKMEIGSGGSGKVYKAVLGDGSVLAVKKIQERSITELGEFLNEVRTLESLKNENLVQLLGWYTRDDQLLLIYEYMEKNSLEKTFFETKSEFFSWEIRYRICLQIAKGLVYLHTNAIRKIIHRDIKSSNILLDEHLNAKISDFGLARVYHEEQGTILTRLCGTHGYMAPEYAMRGILSEKTDVYSYGVVLLEIVSGKSNATYNSSQEGEFLLDQAYVLQNDGSILKLIDPAIINKPGYQAKEASKLLDLAIMCTSPTPSLRPTMSEVVSVLENESTIQEISAAKHNNKPSNDSKHITASGSPVSVESTSISFSGISV